MQLRNTHGTVKNYVISDVTLSQAISFSLDEQDAGIELQLSISPSKAGLRWQEFKICSFDKASDRWYENCNGLIATEMLVESDEVEENREASLLAEAQLKSLDSVQSASEKEIDPDEFYKQLDACGNHYGKPFSLLSALSIGHDQGWSTLTFPDYAELLPGHQMQPHVIHPTILDSFSHIGVLLAQGPCP
jgi:acyl transferase domain-containing protein